MKYTITESAYGTQAGAHVSETAFDIAQMFLRKYGSKVDNIVITISVQDSEVQDDNN